MPIPEACQPLADELEALEQRMTRLRKEQQEATWWRELGLFFRIFWVEQKVIAKRDKLERCIAQAAREPVEDAFQVTFGGTASIEIGHSEAALRGPHTAPISFTVAFNEDRSQVRLPRFPALETPEFDTPVGRNRTSVYRVGKSAAGTFDPASGHMQIPIRLLFDHSIDVPFVEEDSEIDFTGERALTTGEARSPSGAFVRRGSPLDRSTRQITLVGASVFVGGEKVLGGSECALQITGTLSQLP